MGVFFSLAWLGRGVGFGGWLVGAFLVGIVGVGVFWCWLVIERIAGECLCCAGCHWARAFSWYGRGLLAGVFLLAHALAVGCFLAHVDLLARDYFLLALGDWLVIGFGGGRLAVVAGSFSWAFWSWRAG